MSGSTSLSYRAVAPNDSSFRSGVRSSTETRLLPSELLIADRICCCSVFVSSCNYVSAPSALLVLGQVSRRTDPSSLGRHDRCFLLLPERRCLLRLSASCHWRCIGPGISTGRLTSPQRLLPAPCLHLPSTGLYSGERCYSLVFV